MTNTAYGAPNGPLDTCADCGKPTNSPIQWMGTSARCPQCHANRMSADERWIVLTTDGKGKAEKAAALSRLNRQYADTMLAAYQKELLRHLDQHWGNDDDFFGESPARARKALQCLRKTLTDIPITSTEFIQYLHNLGVEV